MSVLRWMRIAPSWEDPDADAVHRIVGDLEAREPARGRRLALFAFLLARVADVDITVTSDETGEMERVLEHVGGLPPAQAALAVQIAKAECRHLGATQNFLAALEFRDVATDGEKTDVLCCLFAVAAPTAPSPSRSAPAACTGGARGIAEHRSGPTSTARRAARPSRSGPRRPSTGRSTASPRGRTRTWRSSRPPSGSVSPSR